MSPSPGPLVRVGDDFEDEYPGASALATECFANRTASPNHSGGKPHMTVTENATAPAGTTPAWSGINHLALITADMDATVRFYVGVLGARLVATVGTPEFRHYFFDFGPHCTVAFFEYAGLPVESFSKPAGVPDPRATQFDHLALNLPDEEALESLRRRLIGAGRDVTEVIDHSNIRSVYFTDPNGIALEASWWVNDVTEGPSDYDDADLFGDPDPVAALRELRATGTLHL